MYRGEYQLGDLIALQLSTSIDGALVQPDDAPRALIMSDSGIVENVQLPITDNRNIAGRFWHCISLDAKYSTGYHWIQYLSVISGITRSSVESFNIQVGGNIRGTGISMEHFRRPPNDFVLVQVDSGFLIRKKNPEVTP